MLRFLSSYNPKIPYTALLVNIGVGLCASVSLAENVDREFIERTRQLTAQIERINRDSSPCNVEKIPLQCHTSSICSLMDNEGLYTLKDSQNRGAINYPMLSTAYHSLLCSGDLAKSFGDEPFLFPDKLYDEEYAGGPEKLQANQAKFRAEMNRTGEVFKDAKSNLAKFLEKQRNSTNSSAIDTMLKRLSSVNFTLYSPNEIPTHKKLSSCELPNAFYNSTDNEVTVCPQFLNASEGLLFFVLAHELSHSIDTCNMHYDQSKQGLNLPEIFGFDPPKPVASKGVPSDKNPFNSAFNCLNSSKTVEHKSFTLSEYKRTYENEMRSNPKSAPLMKEVLNYLDQNFESIKNCSLISGRGQEQEASADWLATEALGEKLKSIPENAKKKEFALMANTMIGDFCPNVINKAQETAKFVSGKNQCLQMANYINNLSSISKKGSSTHPSNYNRINNIVIAHPETRKALDCKDQPEMKRCE